MNHFDTISVDGLAELFRFTMSTSDTFPYHEIQTLDGIWGSEECGGKLFNIPVSHLETLRRESLIDILWLDDGDFVGLLDALWTAQRYGGRLVLGIHTDDLLSNEVNEEAVLLRLCARGYIHLWTKTFKVPGFAATVTVFALDKPRI